MGKDAIETLAQRLLRVQARRGDGPRQVALELKFPLVEHATGAAPTREAVQGLWRHLAQRGWQPLRDAHAGGAIGARREAGAGTDIWSSATGYCVLELSTAPAPSMQALERRTRAALAPVISYGEAQGLLLLGLGIHPITAPSPELLTAKGRNVFWERVFDGAGVHLFTTTAASQAHVDIGLAQAADALAVFNGLAAAQIALSANSCICGGKVEGNYKNVHESFWERWLPDAERVGMPAAKPTSLESHLGRLLRLKPVYVERDGEPVMLPGCASFAHFSAAREVTGITAAGQPVAVQPREEDLDLHLTFCWHNARLSRFCTLENRVNCQQPPEALFAVGALTLGLAERLPQAQELVDRYQWASLRAARVDAMRRGLAARVGDEPVSALCAQALRLAEEGLRARGDGEQAYLEPLWERLRQGWCPADAAVSRLRQGGVRGLLQRFALGAETTPRPSDHGNARGGETR